MWGSFVLPIFNGVHNGWASNILIVVDTGFTAYAGISDSKYYIPIQHDTIKDGQKISSVIL